MPLIAALEERDIFITCASQSGLNPTVAGFLTPFGHRPPNSGVSPVRAQTYPFILRTGSYMGLF